MREFIRTRRPPMRDKRKPARAPARTVKATKREPTAQPLRLPVHIRATQMDLGAVERNYIRQKLGLKLGKYANSIERISVRIDDENGPRGGVDQSCRIKVVLSSLPSVVFESRDASLNAAVDAALSGVQRAVRRATQRQRMKPLRRGV